MDSIKVVWMLLGALIIVNFLIIEAFSIYLELN